MKTPSYPTCLAIHTAQLLLWLVAWFMVPLGLAVGGIKQGPLRYSQ